VFVVKGNRPRLLEQLAGLPWRDVPAVDLTRNAGHDRVESRTIKLAALTGGAAAGIVFPHARLAIQIMRRRHTSTGGRWHTETVSAITDLNWHQIRADQLADVIPGH
jgi:hypothetical protein